MIISSLLGSLAIIGYLFWRWFGASGNALVFVNVVVLRRTRLELGWVTVRRYIVSI